MAVVDNDLIVGPLVPAAGVSVISLDFVFERAEWLIVYRGQSDNPLVLGVDYTVSGAGTASGLVTLTAPANGVDAYSVYLAVALERTTDLQLRGEFRSEPVNLELDRIWQRLQYHNTLLGRSLRVGRTSPALPPLIFDGDDTDGRSIRFNADSTALEPGFSDLDIENAQLYAQQAVEARDAAQSFALARYPTLSAMRAAVVPGTAAIAGGVIYQENANGAVTTSGGKKFSTAWFVTPRMFGAAGDGIADDYAAVQASWTYAAANKIPVMMEGLQYNCSDNPTTRTGLIILGQGATLFATEYPPVGGFFNNVVAGDSLARVQSGVRIYDMITDGIKLPHPSFPGKFNSLADANLIGSAAAWINLRVTSGVTAVTVPGADSTMRLLTDNAINGEHRTAINGSMSSFDPALPLPTDQPVYGFHVIAQAGTLSKIQLSMSGLCPTARVIFDLTNGTIVSTSGVIHSRRAVDLGGGFWALTISVNSTVAAQIVCTINLVNAANSMVYAGAGGNLRVWGAWQETGNGHNTNLGPNFARGMSDAFVSNCVARNMRRGYGGGTGGGGMGGEQGLRNIVFDKCLIENCYRGARVAGVPGNHADAAAEKRNAIGIVFRDLTVKNCETAIFCHSIGEAGDNVSKLDVFDVLFDGAYIEDCGHIAWSDLDYVQNPSILPQKGGVISFSGAQNIRMRGVRVKLNTDYVTRADWLGRSGYPGAGTNYIGAGLTGPVGALVKGWGRNIQIEDMSLDGTVDCARRFARCPELGEIASNPVGIANAENEQNDIAINHVAGIAMANVVNGWKPSASNSSDTFFSETIRFTTYVAVADQVVKADGPVPNGGLSALTNLQVIYRTFSGGEIIGDAVQWLAEPSTVTVTKMMRKGGMELGGGFASDGSRAGFTYDFAASVMRHSQNTTASISHMAFYNPNGFVGGITTSGSATAYNTASDARLKDDPRDFDGMDVIEALRVYDHAWKAGGRGYGVYAQEAVMVMPGAVTAGDEDMPWQVDYSKLVPILIKAVQQLSAKVAQLEKDQGNG